MNIKCKLILPSGEKTTISLPENTQIGKYFQLYELANKQAKEDEKYLITYDSMRFVEMLDAFRKWYNKIITLSCSYRTPTWNKSVGGASNSLHLTAEAADLQIGLLTDKQFNNICAKWFSLCDLYGVVGECGRYSWGVHLGANIKYSKTHYPFDKRSKK